MAVDFQNCFLLILVCFFSLLCYSLLLKKRKDSQDGFDLLPSPPSLPIIGHLHHVLFSPGYKSLQNLSCKYGPLLHLRIVNFPVVLVSSASVAYEIFKAHDLSISSRENPPIDDSFLIGSSVFINARYGDYFSFMKKLLVTKLFGPQALEQSRGVRADELERFYRCLLDKAMKKESVEVCMEATKLSINSICRMSMGRSFSEESGEAERVRGLVTGLDRLTKRVLLATLFRWPLQKLGISPFNKEIMRVSNGLDELLERILVEHEEKPDEHKGKEDLMDVLLETCRDENAEHKITRKHIKSLFVEIFFGGTETSGQTTQWTMAEIINNPTVLVRIREEIDSVVGKTRLIQETDLPNLPYLQAVLKEVLRLYTPYPLLVRKFQEGCEIRGVYVPENTTLVVNAYAVMRDPNCWEDPDEFKPERFLGKEEDIRSLKNLTFGSGRRGCPGSNLGYILVGTAVGMMVQCFEWKIKGEKVNMNEAGGAQLTKAHPLHCTPLPRTKPFVF